MHRKWLGEQQIKRSKAGGEDYGAGEEVEEWRRGGEERMWREGKISEEMEVKGGEMSARGGKK